MPIQGLGYSKVPAFEPMELASTAKTVNKTCEVDCNEVKSIDQLAQNVRDLEAIRSLCEYINQWANPAIEFDNQKTRKISQEIYSELNAIDLNKCSPQFISEKLSHVVAKIKQIEILQVCEYLDRVNTIPETIQYLSGLKFLDLYNNDLTALPEGISKLGNLRRLDISGNGEFNSLPNFLIPMAVTQGGLLRRLLINSTKIYTAPSQLMKVIDPAAHVREWVKVVLPNTEINGSTSK